MKNILASALILLMLSCGNKDKTEKITAVQFAPPVVKEDAEVVDKNIGNSKEENIVLAKRSEGNADTDESTSDATSSTRTQKVDTSKKIVKEGDISFETNNVNETRKKIVHSLKQFGGYVEEDNQSLNNDDNNRKEYVLKIRVPAKKFDFFLDTVSSTADKIDSKNISITDVTTHYIDITTRLANKKTLENSYLELLKKSSKISDLLEIENKLSEIRSDIESTQGQLNYLNKQVAYSALTITFYTKQAVQDNGQTFGYKLKMALSSGWDFLGSMFFGFITLWPLLIIVTILYLLFRSWRKRIGKRKAHL